MIAGLIVKIFVALGMEYAKAINFLGLWSSKRKPVSTQKSVNKFCSFVMREVAEQTVQTPQDTTFSICALHGMFPGIREKVGVFVSHLEAKLGNGFRVEHRSAVGYEFITIVRQFKYS